MVIIHCQLWKGPLVLQLPPHAISVVHLKHRLNQHFLPLTLLLYSVIQLDCHHLTIWEWVLCAHVHT